VASRNLKKSSARNLRGRASSRSRPIVLVAVAVQPDVETGRRALFGGQPRAGAKALCDTFGIDPALLGMAVHHHIGLALAQGFTRPHAQLVLHQIHASDRPREGQLVSNDAGNLTLTDVLRT
jgi:hypothetical protein